MSPLLSNLVHFARVLRAGGLDAGPARMVTAAQALGLVDLRREADVYVALRAALVRRRDELPLFDHAFRQFFFGRQDAAGSPTRRPAGADPRASDSRGSTALPPAAPEARRLVGLAPAPVGAPADAGLTAAPYSEVEILRQKDFERMTAHELEATKRLIRLLQVAIARRRARRLRRLPVGRRLDLRRVMRRNLREGGELLRLAWRGPKLKRRPLVLLCDISGSMERYSRLLLHFVHAVFVALETVEAFVFATRLTRITRQLRTHDVDAALAEVSGVVEDWASGTRIGDALRAFNRRWGRQVLGRGAVVVVMSDGWDRGAAEILREEMARLQRSCHRLIWMNPLLGQPGYQPVTVGMEVALPYVDDFVAAHNLASLESLAELLADAGGRRPARRQRLAPAG